MLETGKQKILLKISGESLSKNNEIISKIQISSIINQIKILRKKYSIGIVVGGGNILRGANVNNSLLSRSSADIMGMLATIINSIALCDGLEANGINTSVYSLITMPTIAKTYNISAIAACTHINALWVLTFCIPFSGLTSSATTLSGLYFSTIVFIPSFITLILFIKSVDEDVTQPESINILSLKIAHPELFELRSKDNNII